MNLSLPNGSYYNYGLLNFDDELDVESENELDKVLDAEEARYRNDLLKLCLDDKLYEKDSYSYYSKVLIQPGCRIIDRSNYKSPPPPDIDKLFAALDQTWVEELQLRRQRIGSKLGEKIASHLSAPSSKIRVLDLRMNRLGDDGVVAIARALMNPNCKLQKLNIGINGTGQVGISEIAKAIIDPNCKLEILKIANCKMNNESATQIAAALRSANCKLKTLNVKGSLNDPVVFETIIQALQDEKCKIEKLVLDECLITKETIAKLVQTLRHKNCLLKKLNVRARFTDETLTLLGKGLQGTRLRSLNVRSTINKSKVAARNEFVARIKHTSLTDLKLAYDSQPVITCEIKNQTGLNKYRLGYGDAVEAVLKENRRSGPTVMALSDNFPKYEKGSLEAVASILYHMPSELQDTIVSAVNRTHDFHPDIK